MDVFIQKTFTVTLSQRDRGPVFLGRATAGRDGPRGNTICHTGAPNNAKKFRPRPACASGNALSLNLKVEICFIHGFEAWLKCQSSPQTFSLGFLLYKKGVIAMFKT